MSEKKYLLSEQDLKCLFHSAWDCMISESNAVEFIKAREYQERTCRRVMRGLKNAPGFVGGFCSECEHMINEGAVYCEHCGAKVTE